MKSFSQFTLKESLGLLGLSETLPWDWEGEPAEVPEALTAQIHSARDHFDLNGSEASRVFLIDIILLAAIDSFEKLRFWKEANLESTIASGVVDYLLAHRAAFFEAPLLCIVEAKRDDFDAGKSQCLVELAACHQVNQEAERAISPLHGIVTNGGGWLFLRWFPEKTRCEETVIFGQGSLEKVLGVLRDIFTECKRLDDETST